MYEPDYVYGRPQQNFTINIVFLEDGLTCVFSYVPPANPMTPEFAPGNLLPVTLNDCLEAPDRLNIPMSSLMQLYSNGVWQNGQIAGFGQIRLTKDVSGKDIWIDSGQKGTPDIGNPQRERQSFGSYPLTILSVTVFRPMPNGRCLLSAGSPASDFGSIFPMLTTTAISRLR